MYKLRTALRPITKGSLCNFHDGVDYMNTALTTSNTDTEQQPRLAEWLAVNDRIHNIDHSTIWPDLLKQLTNGVK
jgi:hypothetical protein